MNYRLQFAIKDDRDSWVPDARRFESKYPISIPKIGDVVELHGVGNLKVVDCFYSYAADTDPTESELCVTLRCNSEPSDT